MMPSPASQPGMPESAQNWATIQRLAQIREAAQHRPLTAEEQAELDNEAPCIHCGGFHSRACPRVRRIVFRQGGQGVQEVEYFLASEIDWTGVVFEDVGDAAEDTSIPSADIETVNEWAASKLALPPEVRAAALRITAWLEGAEL